MLSRKWIAGLAVTQCVSPMWAYAIERSPVEEVVITATMTERDSATSPAFTTVITAEDIARVPGNSIADLLRETVGVNNKTDNTGRDEVQIRGLSGRYTLILIDGKRVSSSGALWRGGDFDYSSIPMGSIERVEIVRGPMAALYGSDAMGGVVNIITKHPTKEWQGSVTGELRTVGSGEEGDQYRVSVSALGAVTDKVSLSVSGEYYDRDAWFANSANDPKDVPVLEEKQSSSFLATTVVKLTDAQTLDIDLSYNHDKRPYGLYSYVYYPAWNYENYSYGEQEITRYTYGLTHKGTWDWGKTVVFVKQEDSEIDDFNTDYDAPQQRQVKEKNTYAKAYGAGVWGRHGLTAGIDYRQQVIEDPVTYLDTGEVSTDNVAVFVQDEISLTEKINFTLGGRVDEHDIFGSHFSPKVYLTYQLSDAITFKGGVSEAYKAPDAYQLSEEYRIISCGGSCYLAGNPDLDPETSVNYEVGFEIRRPTWNMSAVIFNNDVEDMIIAVYDPSGPSREWRNIATAKTNGIELEGSVDVVSTFSINANLTYLDTEYIDADGKETDLDNRPEFLANLGFNWQLTENLTTALTTNYVGKQFYEGDELSGYSRVDLTAVMDVSSAVVMRFGVKNLTDVNLEDKDDKFVTHELGRNYYLSATYNF
ncbi:MAG: TonB-dependent receptor [Spongiibacteraceae bacterium]